MVDRQFKSFQWKLFDSTKTPSTNSDSCHFEMMGTNCMGVETRGKWSLSEEASHINSMELLAAKNAILT